MSFHLIIFWLELVSRGTKILKY